MYNVNKSEPKTPIILHWDNEVTDYVGAVMIARTVHMRDMLESKRIAVNPTTYEQTVKYIADGSVVHIIDIDLDNDAILNLCIRCEEVHLYTSSITSMNYMEEVRKFDDYKGNLYLYGRENCSAMLLTWEEYLQILPRGSEDNYPGINLIETHVQKKHDPLAELYHLTMLVKIKKLSDDMVISLLQFPDNAITHGSYIKDYQTQVIEDLLPQAKLRSISSEGTSDLIETAIIQMSGIITTPLLDKLLEVHDVAFSMAYAVLDSTIEIIVHSKNENKYDAHQFAKHYGGLGTSTIAIIRLHKSKQQTIKELLGIEV